MQSDDNPFTSEIFPIKWEFKRARDNNFKIDSVASSMEEYSKDVLKNEASAKIVLNDEVEISRPGEEVIELEDSLEAYKQKTEQGNFFLKERLGSRSSARLLVVGDSFQLKADNALESVFEKEPASLLAKMLEAMGLLENNYLISAVSLCEGELGSFLNNLKKEAYFFKPDVIMTMGSIATQMVLNTEERLSKLQGKMQTRTWSYPKEKISFKIMPIFHPEYLIINPAMKRSAWDGMKCIIEEFS